MPARIEIDREKLAELCLRRQVSRLALFGSVLRDDFLPESDVDVLVEFLPEAQFSLMELVEMREELVEVFGRDVDLVEEAALRNPFRRHEILKEVEVIYAA